MEQILKLYALPYDPQYPVICFDERPCFLIGDKVEPLTLQTGKVRKEHYAYEKLGSCALLAAIEPLTGYRLGQVHRRRTKREYALFCQALAAAYPEAIKIRLVQDNLNTMTPVLSMKIYLLIKPLLLLNVLSSTSRLNQQVG